MKPSNHLRIIVLGADNQGKSEILFNFLSSTSVPCFEFNSNSEPSSVSSSASTSTSSSGASSAVNSASSSRTVSSAALQPYNTKRRSTFSEVTKKSVASFSNLFSRKTSSGSLRANTIDRPPNKKSTNKHENTEKLKFNTVTEKSLKTVTDSVDNTSNTKTRSRAVSASEKRPVINNTYKSNKTRQTGFENQEFESSSFEEESDVLSTLSSHDAPKTAQQSSRLCDPNASFDPTEQSAQMAYSVNGTHYTVDLADPCYTDQIIALQDMHIRSADAYIFLYNTHNMSSFIDIQKSHMEVLNVKDSVKVPCILWANVNDKDESGKCSGDPREVTTEKGQELASEFQCPYLEMPCSFRPNVEDAILKLLIQWIFITESQSKKKRFSIKIW